MKLIQRIVCILCVVHISACSPLMRGFDGSTLVSTAQPAVSIHVDIPLLVSGQISPYVYTAYGYQFPNTFIAVYGTDLNAPMAVSTLSITPNNWEWDPLSFSMADSPITSSSNFGGENFEGSIHIVHGEKDPFTLLLTSEQKLSSVYWLAQRYSYRSFFNQVKIILEYREPLPSQFIGNTGIPMESPEIHQFQERAKTTFHVVFNSKATGSPSASYLKGINAKFLGNYLGSMSVIEPMIFDR